MRYLVVIALLFFNLFASDLAFDYLNWMRVQAGLVPLKHNEALKKAAALHAEYLLQNKAIGHSEQTGKRGFTAKKPFDRALIAGFGSRFVLENISYGEKDAFGSIDTLFASIYHRLAFLNPYYDLVGIAKKSSDSYRFKRVYVYELGNSLLDAACRSKNVPDAGMVYTNICMGGRPLSKEVYDASLKQAALLAPKLILWPYPGARDIPPAFYEEIPDPLPECSVSGYPISVIFNPAKSSLDVSIEEFSLFQDGRKIEARLLTHLNDPNKKLREFEYVLMPLQRLEFGRGYDVVLRYKDERGVHEKRWSFHTKNAPFTLVKLKSKTIVHTYKLYTLYKEPSHCNDTITGFWIRCQRGVRYSFRRNDKNSYNILLKSKRSRSCKIRVNKEYYRLNISRK